MIEWMKANGDLVENWAFGSLAYLTLAVFIGSLAVLGLSVIYVHLREIRRAVRKEDREERRRRTSEMEDLLR